MNNYENPELTQREIVETSLAAVLSIAGQVNDAVADAEALRSGTMDVTTLQVVAQHISILNGSKMQIEKERLRLANIIAVWNGETPSTTGDSGASNTSSFAPAMPVS